MIGDQRPDFWLEALDGFCLNNRRMKFLRMLLVLMMFSQLQGGVPEALAYQTIPSPYHEVTGPIVGASVYEGQLHFTDRLLVVYEPQILDWQGNVQSWGYLEVFDRLTFVKLGEIHPNKTSANKRWGTSLAVEGDYLAVGCSGTDKTPGVDVFSLKTFRRLYHLNSPGSSTIGYGGALDMVGKRLLVHWMGGVSIHDLPTGKLLGTVPLSVSCIENSRSLRFVMYSDAADESGHSEPCQIVDLRRPTESLRIRDLPFLDPNRSSLDVKRAGKHLCLIEHKNGSASIHGYDLVDRKRLFTVNTKDVSGNSVTVWKDRLFISDAFSNDGVIVRDLNTGKVTGNIALGTESKDQWFGYRIACVRDKLFVSSDRAWYAYDPSTLKLLFRADDQGWDLSLAEPVPVKGTDLIGFVFNLNNYSGFLINSYYYNPQVMLLDVRRRRFTHRLNLEDAIIIGGFNPPLNFGRSLYAAGPASVAVERPGFGGDYKVYSLSPSAGGIHQARIASVSYDSTLGYGFEVRRVGSTDPMESVAIGSGKTVVLDVPYAEFVSGADYELVRNQRFRVKDDYDVPWEDLKTLLGGNAEDVAIHGELAVVSVPEHDSPKTAAGAVFVLNLAKKKIVRMIKEPNAGINHRFGSSIDLDGERLAVGSTTGVYVYNIETGTLLASFPAAVTVALSGNILIRGYNEGTYANGSWTYNGKATAYDLTTGKSLYTVPTGYMSRFSYDTTRIALGATRMLLGLNVHDLATGVFQFKLSSPNPQTDDNFSSSIAVDGDVAAVGASGQGAAYLFDLTTGQSFRTCQIQDRPEGFTNYYISGGGLNLNVAAGLLAWVVPDQTSSVTSGIHLFDISTGEEIVKIISPTEEVATIPYPPGSPSIPRGLNIHTLANAVALDGNRLIFLQDGGTSLGSDDVSETRETPLVREIVSLSAAEYLEVAVETRRDTTYQLFAGHSPAQMSDTGIVFQGTGGTVVRRVPIPSNTGSWIASVRLKWANLGNN